MVSCITWVTGHFGPKTVRTQDSSALVWWVRTIRAFRHQTRGLRDYHHIVLYIQSENKHVKTRFSKSKRLQCTQLGTSLTDIIWKRDVNYKTGSINTSQRRQNRTEPRPQFKHQKLANFGVWFLRYAVGETDRRTHRSQYVALSGSSKHRGRRLMHTASFLVHCPLRICRKK